MPTLATISGAPIRHIDTRFVLERGGDYDGLFADTDLSGALTAMAAR